MLQAKWFAFQWQIPIEPQLRHLDIKLEFQTGGKSTSGSVIWLSHRVIVEGLWIIALFLGVFYDSDLLTQFSISVLLSPQGCSVPQFISFYPVCKNINAPTHTQPSPTPPPTHRENPKHCSWWEDMRKLVSMAKVVKHFKERSPHMTIHLTHT